MNTKTIFSVRDGNGAYTTQTVHGQRASSTSCYEAAARSLAGKLHPCRVWELKVIRREAAVQVFELELRA